MTVADIDNLISILKSDATLTSMVSANDIKVGWVSTVENFPCIVITLISENAVGRIGYKSSSSGNKLRYDTGTFQIDVYVQNEDGGARKAGQICDRIEKLLLPSITGIDAMSKSGDVMMYDDEMNVWRRSMRWDYKVIHAD